MDYFENITRLLKIEWEEELVQFEKKVTQTPLHERKKQGFAWYPIHVSHIEIGTGEQLHISIERTTQIDEPHRFQVGDSVALFHNTAQAGKANESINGVIVALFRNNMRIALPTRETPDWIDERQLGVDWLFDTASYKEMQEAIDFVRKAEKEPTARLRAVLTGEKQPTFKPEVGQVSLPKLNDSQNKAIQHILSAEDVAIIHGPPGTGKTTTLVEAIRITLQSEKQVLVVAPSNTAVDLLTQKLAQAGLSVLRIGNPARIEESVQDYSLDAQILQHQEYKQLRKIRKSADDFRKMAHKYKRNFGKDEREQRKLLFAEAHKMLDEASNIEKYIVENLLQNAQVITATLVGSVNRYIKKRVFSTVFIDEAAQALEPATWIPIAKAHRVVLAGDHCQLPPTVKSSQALKEGLGKTLMEKMINLYPQSATMLEVQYRMHTQIMGFSNQQFYAGKLKAHASVADRTLAIWEGAQSPPIEFIDTAGCSFDEKMLKESTSKFNPEEASLLIKHLTELVGSKPAHEKMWHIGIISPYSAQVSYVESLVKEDSELKTCLPNMRISSVDGFQGQECEVIYISLVRSNDEGEIGFLSDTRRMNVALTRAKQKLVVIGDSATLALHPFYQAFLAYVEGIGAHKSAWEYA
ncbi:MAG: DEAD/DEAH box helicase [Bacteroidetes bacterium]|nr:MAG: DEAD/DEAH box helicase [Bacteroidota bacterium]